MRFSQRKGITPVKCDIQIDSMDQELRNAIWNVVLRTFDEYRTSYSSLYKQMQLLYQRLWVSFFKEPLDYMDNEWERIRILVMEGQWYEVYDIIEFIAQNYDVVFLRDRFTESCNDVLESELSGYRFIGETITEITAPEEIEEIEQAINLEGDKFAPIRNHLRLALEHLSNRKNPNFRDSIKESMSGVEAICSIIGGKKATLGTALKKIKDKIGLHPALEEAFSKLYGYASDAEGIRHALLEEANLDFEDAKFMLVACSGFVNYLIVKGQKAGILEA